MATATKRKSLPDDNATSNPPPTTKRLKGLEHARHPDNPRITHKVTFSKSNKRTSSSSIPSASEPSTGSESDGSTSQSPSAPSSSSESDAEASEEEPESEDDSASTSSSSSSSSDASSSNDNTTILTLPIPRKPSITRRPPSATTSDLHQRLSTFLPNLAAANDELEVERAAGRLGERNIETVDDDEYIEMSLGLGVLEEKGLNWEGSGSNNDDDGSLGGDDLSDEEGDVDGGGEQGLRGTRGETDVFGKLLRRKKSKVKIQVIDAG